MDREEIEKIINDENLLKEEIARTGGLFLKDLEKLNLFPVRFWDVYGKMGLPVRTTISEMGPELISRLLGLNDTQTGIMRIVFRIADDKGLLLIDLKDLRSMVQYVGDNAKEYKLTYPGRQVRCSFLRQVE